MLTKYVATTDQMLSCFFFSWWWRSIFLIITFMLVVLLSEEIKKILCVTRVVMSSPKHVWYITGSCRWCHSLNFHILSTSQVDWCMSGGRQTSIRFQSSRVSIKKIFPMFERCFIPWFYSFLPMKKKRMFHEWNNKLNNQQSNSSNTSCIRKSINPN